MAVEAAPVSPSAPVRRAARVDRDEVYWTELEVRRLGNLVAEMIQSCRYVGRSAAACDERALMRRRLDAMRRKALRVLVRAELHTKSSHTTWPGLDPNLTQPVSLAEEYVRTVANYLAVLDEEEEAVARALEDDVDVGDVLAAESAKAARRGADTQAGEAKRDGEARASGTGDNIPSIEEFTSGVADACGGSVDDVSYREALAQEKAESAAGTRDELLGPEGLRRRNRKGNGAGSVGASRSSTGKYSKEDEELMKRHQPVQDQLTSDLVDLVGRLKGNLTEINKKIVKDGQVIDEAEDALDKNLTGISRQRENLDRYSKSTSMSWWTICLLVVAVVVTFLIVLALTRVPI